MEEEKRECPRTDWPYSRTEFEDGFIAGDDLIDSREGVELMILDGEEPGQKLAGLITLHGDVVGIGYRQTKDEWWQVP